MDICHWRFYGCRVHGNIDSVGSTGIPVGSHHDDAGNAMGERGITTGFPVVSGFGFLPEHHCRAMREEVDWCKGHDGQEFGVKGACQKSD
jgi:hypothetical protein